ncbi:MAG: carbohydrate-binding domain-containing protein, partial [Ruminococcus sp.]|nr:carbohydrate-binding domain-containing protein [Ruminococcus sp.]
MKNSLIKTFGFLIAVTVAVSTSSCSAETLYENNSSENLSESSDNSTSQSISDIQTSEITATQTVSDSDEQINSDYRNVFSDRDLNPQFDNVDTEIKLNGDSAEYSGNGVSVDGSEITIYQEGIYKLSGTLNDGQIIVNAPDAKVQLILDNADISCSTSSAIYGIDSKKIFISLAENSVNTLADGELYNYA